MTNGPDFKTTHGLEIFEEARLLLEKSSIQLEQRSPDASSTARSALGRFASAMNWLEGSEHFEVAHDAIHDAGTWVRQSFPSGCELERDGDNFRHTCPVAIAHKRFGFSPRMTANAICSICATDLSDCPHRPGHTYEVTAAVTSEGWCNACGDKECDEHEIGMRYQADARVIITEVYEIAEISIVAIPQQPDARLVAIPISRSDLEELRGGPIPDDMYVRCDNCLSECPGLEYLEL